MGPTYKSSKIEGNKIRIQFENVGSGLTIGTAPPHFYISEKKPPAPPASDLQGFAVAGADNKFVWATAAIEPPASSGQPSDTVVVTSNTVPDPVAVRYAWADDPACNLYNKEGLPAAPFRTDALPLAK
jgi:sialate O-acetylesterase